MASTRNKNTPGNYILEQRNFSLARDYESYHHSQYGKAYSNALPCLGFNPSHMPMQTFAHNPIEIEGALFGINSTNLVTPEKPVNPELIKLPEISYFDRVSLYMPEQLVVQTDQRPFPIPK